MPLGRGGGEEGAWPKCPQTPEQGVDPGAPSPRQQAPPPPSLSMGPRRPRFQQSNWHQSLHGINYGLCHFLSFSPYGVVRQEKLLSQPKRAVPGFASHSSGMGARPPPPLSFFSNPFLAGKTFRPRSSGCLFPAQTPS